MPNDPLELATGSTQIADTPERRALVLGLLERARQNNAMHTPGGAPFTLKASFNSSGQNRYVGPGETEETWISGERWRWTARLGDYSQLRISYRGLPYDEKSPGPAPLRLQMARAAIFWPVAGNFAAASLRLASAKWDGVDVMCILRSDGEGSNPEKSNTTVGRRWEETEYCIDPKLGLLRAYSDAPGIYTVFDYSDSLHFHGRTLARQISVVEGGNTILQIHLDSIEDPNESEPNLFVPSPQMLARGPGPFLMGRIHFSQTAPAPTGHAGEVQPVVVIASLDKDGKVLEAEALQNSDSSLSNAALALVQHSTYAPSSSERLTQRTAFVEVRFVGKD
ncbi:MAG TPA: hypothetical protein VFA74_15460 [Terriglobales bacterium]|nr:hypothetical protein [Terriglobales bacterium]